MTRRRPVIKSVAGIASLNIVGSVNAENRSAKTSSSSSRQRLRRQILEAVKKDGTDGVRKLLERENIKYEMVTTKPAIDVENNSEVSIQEKYLEDESEFGFYLNSGDSDDRVRATVVMKLKAPVASFKDACRVNDAVGITFDDDHWSVVGSPYINSTRDSAEAEFYSDSLEEGGLAGTVNHLNCGSITLPTDVIIVLETQLENLDGVAGSIFGSYEHTQSITGGSIKGISGGAGAFEVDLDFASTAWQEAEGLDPEPFFG